MKLNKNRKGLENLHKIFQPFLVVKILSFKGDMI